MSTRNSILTIVVLIIVLIYSGWLGWVDSLERQSNKRIAVDISKQETERLKLVFQNKKCR